MIHASKVYDKDGEEFAADILTLDEWNAMCNRPQEEFQEFQRGGIIGIANLVAVKLFDAEAEKHNPDLIKDPWFVGKYGFVLEGARPFSQMYPMSGRLNIFDVVGEDAEAIQSLLG